MSTVLRAELSEKNKYFVDKHRYYELKHFCLQYPTWKKLYSEIDGYSEHLPDEVYSRIKSTSDPTFKYLEKRLEYFYKMELLEKIALDADPDLASYILKGVTEGLSYPQLKSRLNIPCSRDMYYDRYRKFFWLLDRTRK